MKAFFYNAFEKLAENKSTIRNALTLYFEPYDFSLKVLQDACGWSSFEIKENELHYYGSNPHFGYRDDVITSLLKRYAYRNEYIVAPSKERNYATYSQKEREAALEIDKIKNSVTINCDEDYLRLLEKRFGCNLRNHNVWFVIGHSPFFSGEWNNNKNNYSVVVVASNDEKNAVLRFMQLRDEEEKVQAVLGLTRFMHGNMTFLPSFRYYAHNWRIEE